MVPLPPTTARIRLTLRCGGMQAFADGGDLEKKIKQQAGRPFPEKQILDWFIQASTGPPSPEGRSPTDRSAWRSSTCTTARSCIAT
jgi:hypothetical protein